MLNALIDEWDTADDARRIGSRPHTVGEHFAIEAPLLAPLPAEPFETGRLFTRRVDRSAKQSSSNNPGCPPPSHVWMGSHGAMLTTAVHIVDR